VEPKKPALNSKSGSEKASGPWRPTKRRVLWAIGMVVALVTTALLVVNLYPGIWEELSQKRVASLIGIVVALTVIRAPAPTTTSRISARPPAHSPVRFIVVLLLVCRPESPPLLFCGARSQEAY
jgi:hypothetical protein